MKRVAIVLALPAVLHALARHASAAPDPASTEFFETKVRPVLAERCYQCHSTESGKSKGGLRVDARAALLSGGDNGPSLVPGKPDASKLIEAVSYKNVDLQMPPKGKLTDQQVADLTAWVQHGAAWPEEKAPAKPTGPHAAAEDAFDLAKRKAEHWAWQPIKRVDPPAVKDAAWPRDDADRFVLAKLEEKGLAPAADADRRTLIRRATFDLTGLPPTPAEVDAFLADRSPDAFAKVVDRLLASPAFGERWGRHWLDLMRFAETRGHEFDVDAPNAFQYRDYVIRAFNADVPYDRLVTEHLAGDLLPSPRTDPTGTTNESVVATGFWFLGEWLHSPVDIRQDECDRVDNQIDVFGKAMLGLTISCARCHDHKFDAISTKDYYALAGFLHSSSYRDVRFQHEAHNRDVARRLRSLDDAARPKLLAAFVDARRPALAQFADALRAAGAPLRRDPQAPPEMAPSGSAKVWAGDLKKAKADPYDPLHPWAALSDANAQSPAQVAETLAPVFAQWRTELDRAAAARAESARTALVDYDALRPGEWIDDGLAFGDGPVPAGEVSVTTGPDGQPVLAARERGVAFSGAVGPRLPGMLRTPSFTVASPKLAIRVAGSGEAFVCIDSHRLVRGPLHRVSSQPFKGRPDQYRTIVADLSAYVGQRAHVEFTAEREASVTVAGVWQADAAPDTESRVSPALFDALSNPPVQLLSDLAARYQRVLAETADRVAAGNAGRDHVRLADWLIRRAERFTAPGASVTAGDAFASDARAYQEQRTKLLAEVKSSATAMALLDGSAFDERVLIRGSVKTPGDVVPRRLLEALGGTQHPITSAGSGRLELARQVTDPAANPLLPRVMANRVWHHLFGRGIVASTDNFGVLGDRPTHPELLDALADRYVKVGWSTKRLIRGLMLSRAYGMSSRAADETRAAQVDPQNLLLHRMPVRRLQGEAIRDGMLALSGRLDRAMYGPGVEVHLTPFMDGRGKPGASGPLDGAGRRSVYLKVRRNFLNPMLVAFDMPQPFSAIGRRSLSNVPAQALILMNDPFVVKQAEGWAKRVLEDKSLATPRARVERLYLEGFARPPTESEVTEALAFVERQGEALGVAQPDRATNAGVWADLAHVLMNVKEFIYLN